MVHSYNENIFYLIHNKTNTNFFFVFCPFRATPVAYEGSQAWGLIRAIAAGLCQRHSNMGSEPHLQLIPQLTATPDPQPTEKGNLMVTPQPHGS